LDWFFGTLQVVVALVALYVAWEALKISRQIQQDEIQERERADDRQRLMWMQTLLNSLTPVTDARAANNEREYTDGQRWMLSCLAAGSLRNELPLTQTFAQRPFSEPWAGMDAMREQARLELHEKLEYAGDRLYAGERIE
jgi:hypothetical protein